MTLPTAQGSALKISSHLTLRREACMESMFSRVLQSLVEWPCQERENLQSDHILLVQVIVKWFLRLLTLSLSELFAKLTFSLWFLLSTSKKKGINVVKKLQLWDISQSNQCEVSLDVKPEMPTESQLLDDFVVLSEVITYLLTLNDHDYTCKVYWRMAWSSTWENEQFEVAHEKQSIFVLLQIFLLKFLWHFVPLCKIRFPGCKCSASEIKE